MVGIIVKEYAHFNRSLPNWTSPQGVWVKGKDHYDRLCKEAGMIPYEKAQQLATGPKTKDYILSQKAKSIIQAAKNSKDSKGRVKISDRTIDAMVEIGAIGKTIPDYMKLPSNYDKGV